MLFGLNRGLWYDLATIKHVAEIILCDDAVLYHKLINSNESEILKVLGDKGEDQSPVQQIVAYLENLGARYEKVEWFKRSLTLYLTKFKERDLVYEYLKVPYVEDQMRSRLNNSLRKRFRITTALSDADWSDVYTRFSQFVLNYSTGYAYLPFTNGIVGFLVNAFERQYLKYDSSYILELVNSRGMNQEYDDADYSRASYTTIDISFTEDLENFDMLATKVYKLSEFFYKHSGQVYYDIFSRYKFKKVSVIFDRIRGMLDQHFDYASLYSKPELIDINLTIKSSSAGDTEKLALSKKKERDSMISYLDGILDDRVGETDLSKLIKEIEDYNSSLYAQHGKKEQRVVLDIGEYKARLKLTNDERLARMISAMCALRDFIKYLQRVNVSVFMVPSAIFQNELLIRRFRSFKEYQTLYGIVSELLEDEEDTTFNLVRNDEVYESLMKETRIVIGSIPLITIKDVLEDIDKRAEEAKAKSVAEEYISRAKLLQANEVVKRFRGASQSSMGTFADKFPLANKVIYQPTIDHVVSNNLISQLTTSYWTKKDKDFLLHDFATKTIAINESMYNEFILKYMPKDFNRDTDVLSFTRFYEFVHKFVAFVERSIGVLASQIITSDLRMYFFISEHSKLFNLPKNPSTYRDFEWVLDEMNINFYVEENQRFEDIEPHLISLYNLMYSEFSDLFHYLSDLYRTKYSPLTQNFNLVDQYMYEIPESELIQVSFEIYMQEKTPVTGVENFDRFKAGCKPDPKTKFLFRNGEIYKRRYVSGWKYLHEYGFWVYKFGDQWQREPVTKNDTFGVE
jgi:hypothetical protein